VGAGEDGREGIRFADAEGVTRTLPVPEDVKATQTYEEGRLKHVQIAVRTAMADAGEDAEAARGYLEAMVREQVEAGAEFLDLNVDEISLRPADQVAAMRWLVGFVEALSPVPLSIDSSSLETIEAGIEASRGSAGPPMLNSASLERAEALDLAAAGGGPVIVTAAGSTGMPSDAGERVANATRIVAAARAKGIPDGRLYVDPLVFPISVDPRYGQDCLAAIRHLRESLGPEIRLTGGMSNVSFGIPNRRLVNDVFLLLAIEAGADSGIIDPLTTSPGRSLALDRESRPVKLALDALTGADPYCRAYIKAWRAGELDGS
jgi:5-methyltetrahydrofolate--homocysteine methyltransferase